MKNNAASANAGAPTCIAALTGLVDGYIWEITSNTANELTEES